MNPHSAYCIALVYGVLSLEYKWVELDKMGVRNNGISQRKLVTTKLIVDEIALKDVPAMLQLVKYHTRSRNKMIYIGHSLGTTAALMYASEYPDAAANTVGLFVLLTPAYKLTNMRSPYRFLFPLLYPVLDISNALNLVQLVSRGSTRNVTRPLCLSSAPLMLACLNVMNLFLGPFTQISPETIPVYFNQVPGGTSLKTISYLTEATRGQFRKYNYGVGETDLCMGAIHHPNMI
ncbi:hypothetical protein NQ315_015508 [Exocentrus adspersus]|uniref:AB hydrolase-1 domain-containing protein n=1 Tax=Exocentrus adspersus TaxID=1586481 RepID=A0AAV8VPG0_9CUCU|nr:hypothetical protein NQ315_015508 [Exocentrus adspersus]